MIDSKIVVPVPDDGSYGEEYSVCFEWRPQIGIYPCIYGLSGLDSNYSISCDRS